MAKAKTIQKNIHFNEKEIERLQELSRLTGITSESAVIRFLINERWKEEMGFLKYLEDNLNKKKK